MDWITAGVSRCLGMSSTCMHACMLKEDGAIMTQKGMSSLFVLVKPSVSNVLLFQKH